MAQVPLWATQLVKEVAVYKGRSKLPKIKCIKRDRFHTSGWYHSNTKLITLCLGSDKTQYKGILLHELAHWLAPRRAHHSKKFWLVLRELLVYFDCYTDKVKQSEFNYMKKAQRYL